jgi:butyryl-CoA dehydrogenase
LNGTKAWVTSGEQAQAAIIFATIDKCQKHKGIAAFLVDMNQSGVQRGKNERKIGIKATSTCTISLDNVRVHSSNILCPPGEGFKVAMEQLDQARIGIASQALGIAQASLDTAINYAAQRVQFDSPIIRMSSIKRRLAEMALQIESSRLLVRQAAQKKDDNLKSTKFTSMAKWQASLTATFCAHNCVQIMGGMGVVEDMPAERYYRDARITEIYGGVTDVQMMIVAEQLQKEYGL